MIDQQTLDMIPTYVLLVFRLAGLMMLTPVFGSSRVPRRVKAMFVIVIAASLVGSVERPPALPETLWALTSAIAGEIVFGMAMGLGISLTFVAAQWGGEMIGQKIGFNMSEVLDPQFGGGGSQIGELYFMAMIAIFLLIGGHRELVAGVRESIETLPLLSAGLDATLFDTLVGLLSGATTLAFRLAAPVFVTVLVADLAMGALSKTMPQLNIMSVGLALRLMIGLVVLIAGIYLSTGLMAAELESAVRHSRRLWHGG